MKFRSKNLRAISEMIIGDANYFHYRSSYYITEFFQECGLDYSHDGSTRWRWTAEILEILLAENQSNNFQLPDRFLNALRVLMDKAEAEDDDPDRNLALAALNIPLGKEGFEAYYEDDRALHVKHTGTNIISKAVNPHRPFTPNEIGRRAKLITFLDICSEDELTEDILLPLFRQLGFHRVSAAGHEDKALEYGKDAWMRYVLPTQHVIYFGIQVKKGKLDASGKSKAKNTNMSEIYHQAVMMLGHEVFDPETNKRSLVDHAFIIAGGKITKQAKNWLVGKLDASQRSQILFMDREDILNLFIATNIPLPDKAVNSGGDLDLDDVLPF